jgi:hypothetical protein
MSIILYTLFPVPRQCGLSNLTIKEGSNNPNIFFDDDMELFLYRFIYCKLILGEISLTYFYSFFLPETACGHLL